MRACCTEGLCVCLGCRRGLAPVQQGAPGCPQLCHHPALAVPQMLVVFKSAPILKRALKVKQAMMQLYVLKLLKVQTKYLGRQWRKSNMKTMSAIYQKVRHRLNDDWAYGNGMSAAAATCPVNRSPSTPCRDVFVPELSLCVGLLQPLGLGRFGGDGIVGKELAVASSVGNVGGCLLCAYAFCSL